jgi:hypothetical protein
MAPVRAPAPVAALGTYWREKRNFSDREVATVEALAGALGDALKSVRAG